MNTWQQYDDALRERAWAEIGAAEAALETSLLDAEQPETAVLAERIDFLYESHRAVVTIVEDPDHENPGEPELCYECECGETYEYGTYSEHAEHLAYIAAEVLSEDRLNEAWQQFNRLRDALDLAKPRDLGGVA